MKKSTILLWALPLLIACGGGESESTETEEQIDVESEAVQENLAEVNAIKFDCASTDIDTLEAWPESKRAILAGRQEGKILLLVGPYFDGEIEKKGTVRANGMALLFEDALTPNEMGFASRSVGPCEDAMADYLHEFKYKWVWRNEDITENYDHTLVYYKFDSDEEIESENVRAYFDEVAAQMAETGESALLIGHTDADGTDEYNEELGMERAMAFKRSLMKRGVAEDKITVESKGRTQPIASNETEEGRQLNRRVELRIVK